MFTVVGGVEKEMKERGKKKEMKEKEEKLKEGGTNGVSKGDKKRELKEKGT